MNRRLFVSTLVALALGGVAHAQSNYLVYAHGGSVSSLATDGKILFSGGGDSIARYDTSTKTKTMWAAHGGYVTGLSLAKNNAVLASIGADTLKESKLNLKLWNPATGERLALASLTSEPLAVAASPDGQRIAVGCLDGSVLLYGVAEKAWKSLGKHTTSGDLRVLSIAYSPDGKTVVSGGVDKKISVWDVAAMTKRGTLTGHTDTVMGMTFCPDGVLASTSFDRTVRLWNVSTLAAVGSPGKLSSSDPLLGFKSIAVSPDGTKLLTGSDDDYPMVWWTRSGSSVTTTPTSQLKLNTNDTNAVIFINGTTAASGSSDYSVRIFPVGTTSK